jgi:hypothetical protein
MKFFKSEVLLKLKSGDRVVKCLRPISVESDWAIHRKQNTVGDSRGWNITWVPSGAIFQGFKNLKSAKNYFEELQRFFEKQHKKYRKSIY